ncbi:MAG: ATP-binding protein [Clostridia bacterium]|nr:ATP-binding protein [Clostridia bacterium]
MMIPKRVASTLINSLGGGVVPRTGLAYVAVGREKEISALLHDVDIVADGGASFRFIVGKYGSGKSFLLQTTRNYVMDKSFVVADADLSPERRLHGTKGQGLATYKELIKNLSVKTRPDGGALSLILDRWISSVMSAVAASGVDTEDAAFSPSVEKKIFEVASSVSELTRGFDFAKLLVAYYRAYLCDDEETKSKVLRWFRGEYETKSEAKGALGVNVIITDDDWYEYVKVFSRFFVMAGYSGFIVLIDELVNIYKIPNAVTRQYNYEKILTMYNDTLQGKASHLGIIMCSTPECLEDTRRGIYSYEALRSRLAAGKFSGERRDMLSPVIRLSPLTNEELLVLTEKLTEIHSALYDRAPDVNTEDAANFIKAEFSRIGAETLITPREIIRDWIEILNILYQDPSVCISDLIKPERFSAAASGDGASFAEFEI